MNDGRMTELDEMNFRIKMTRTIWFFATCMLGICIPLAEKTYSGPVVPLAVLIATTIATRVIWGRDGVKNASSVASALPNRSAPASAPGRVQELEERLANLEAITNFENKLLDVKHRGAAATSAASVSTPPAYTFETPVAAPPVGGVGNGSEEMRRGAARPVAS